MLATNTGTDLAAYFFPAKATMYPPEEDWNRVKKGCALVVTKCDSIRSFIQEDQATAVQ
jgi:hypothetical protein